LLKNIGSNWALSAVQILVFMVLSPFVVDTLGEQVNGVWVSIVALTGFLQLLILGVPMASVRYIAEHVAKGDTKRANEAVSTCLAICLVMGAVALAIGAVLYPVFDAKYLSSSDWKLTPETIRDARIAFGVVVLTVTLGFAARLPYGIFDAHHDFLVRNLVMGGGFILKLGLTVLLLSMKASLVYLATVQVVVMVAEFCTAIALVRRRHAGVRLSLAGFDRSLVGGILSFSIFAMLLNVGSKLAFQADALVIGQFMAPDRITVYDIGFKVFDPMTNLVLAVGMVVMPMATALRARGEARQLAGILFKWTKIALTLVLMIGAYLLVLGPEFLDWWFAERDTQESGRLLQILLVSFLFFLPVRGVALPILMGLGKPRRPALALLLMGIVNVLISLALIKPYGLVGVALGTAIPNVMFAIFVLTVACAELDVRPAELLGYAAGRLVPAALLASTVLVFMKFGLHVAGFTQLFVAGVVFVCAYGALLVFWVYRGDPHVDLHARIFGKATT